MSWLGACGQSAGKCSQHWLCLAPGNKISGDKVSSRTQRSSSRAAVLLRPAAPTVRAERHGAFAHSIDGWLCVLAKALTATGRKIAVLFYNTPRPRNDLQGPGCRHYEEQHRRRVVAN